MLDGYNDLTDIDGLIDATVARLDEAKRQAKETERPKQTDIRRYFEQPTDRTLPTDLDDLIRLGAPIGQRSERFFHVVGWLKDRGHSPGDIEGILAAHPDGIAEKFIGRLRAEIDRAFDKAETKAPRSANSGASRLEERRGDDPPFELKWHGDPDDAPLKEWLVDKTLPKVGLAFLSGQWGTYKTFVGFDLSACTITGQPFAGRDVMRRGGVLWVAVEGQDEVRIRLAGLIHDKVRPVAEDATVDPERLPFVWVEKCPTLTSDDAVPKLRAIVKAAAEGLKQRFDLPLALMIIDTLSPAAGFRDANDAAENQRVMTTLITVAREFVTICIAVDHMGKDVTTGTRNSSVKEDAADAVLALPGEKDLAGNVVNPRMAIRKVRGAPTGQEIKFDKRIVPVDEWGNTTLVIDWSGARGSEAPADKAEKPAWSGKAKFLKDAIERAMIAQGVRRRPFGMEGPEVKTIGRESVRAEFYKTYSADDAGTKRKAFNRLVDDAAVKGLIATIEIAGSDWIWFAKSETGQET